VYFVSEFGGVYGTAAYRKVVSVFVRFRARPSLAIHGIRCLLTRSKPVNS
jgi:hypothetical protein